MAAAYFDDNLLVDIASSAQRAKDMLCWAFSALGTPPKAAKAFPMQSHRAFLGAVLDLGEVATEGIVTVIPKEANRHQVIDDVTQSLQTGHMTSAQVAKT